MPTLRIGLICLDRPYLRRALASLMVNGLRGFKESYSVELFDGQGNAGYMKPLKDKYPQLVIHSDGNKRNVLENALLLWSELRHDAEWIMQFPDDFVVCLDFVRYAYNFAIKHSSKFDVFSFYTPYREVCDTFKQKKEYWVWPAPKFYGGLGLVVKSSFAHEVVNWLTSSEMQYHLRRQYRGWDLFLKHFLVKTKRNVCACVPNLVQHIGKVSACGHVWDETRGDRIAPCFIGEGKSPFQIKR